MILHDVCLYGIPGKKHIHIEGGIILTITDDRKVMDRVTTSQRMELDGALVLPGFINSHDHLDFNCYPASGNRQYTNYTQWGKDIHATHAAVINAVKRIPHSLRVQWGLYKNLLSGFTTVVNHGEKLQVADLHAGLYQDCHSLHSPSFEPNWILKLNHPFRKAKLVVMHIGEGTDAIAHKEIDRVISRNWFKKSIVAVHGVAMDAEQAGAFTGLVWCPASNYFLLGATADIETIRTKTAVLFGTDSTLTAPWWGQEHFTAALASGKTNEQELLDMLTSTPARVWKMKDRGVLAAGMRADLIVKKNSQQIFHQFQQELLLVIRGGEIMAGAGSMPIQAPDKYDTVLVNGNNWYVKKGIRELTASIQSVYPELQLPFTIV
jgi:cytosine/adenosine deaminase-related metal-dependent hydrolase